MDLVDATGAAEPVPELVIGDRPPTLVKPAQAPRNIPADQDPWEWRHGTLQEMPRLKGGCGWR
jgi:hypothetical protein